MKKVIVSGAGGQLGRAFLKTLSFHDDFSVYSFDRNQLDIADGDKIHRLLEYLPQVQYWINCGAYTKVDDAEKFHHEAELYNATAPGYIAKACKDKGIHFFHFSSDYVYHNDLRRPLQEDDPTEPKGVYAKTKLAGEKAIRETSVNHTIIRTSWVYGPGGHNFVNTMLRLGKEKSQLNIVGDQIGAPTYTLDITAAIKQLILLHASGHQPEIQGIFNFANTGEVTWDNFAREIFRIAKLDCQVHTISSAEYGAPAPRPPYSVLNCNKIQGLLKMPIPSWEDALHRYLASGES
ncbi:MAG TPA: dTDP-4-dehydrorhamnose reductase [Saprospiraceae bacterium]|nr:dTDP-4-dehydrorhamnose reductase [Saprospiraceae bacterium]